MKKEGYLDKASSNLISISVDIDEEITNKAEENIKISKIKSMTVKDKEIFIDYQ